MNTNVSKAVEDVVKENVRNCEMFTAHDVTLKVRNDGHFLKHEESRDAVHDLWNRGEMGISYTRSQISVPGGTPWLYHPVIDDPAQYQNVRQTQTQTQTSGASQTGKIQIPSFSADGSDDSDDSDVNQNRNSAGQVVDRVVDSRGTLSLPAPVLKSMGYKPGDVAYILTCFDGIEICKNPSDNAIAKYTVDNKTQIRITKHALNRAGLKGERFDVDAKSSKDKMIVKLH